MHRKASLILLSCACLTVVGCASKTTDRVGAVETTVVEVQRAANDRMELQGRQIAALNQQMQEMTRRTEELARVLNEQGAEVRRVAEYLEKYDSTWNTFTRLQSEYDNEMQALRDQQLAAANSLAEARRDLDTALKSVSGELTTARNDLRQRIDRTNGDVFRLREQSKEKLDDMSAAMLAMGKGLQEILALQRAQFQAVTETYTNSLSEIEPYLPAAMISNLNTPELLVSPNPDVQSPQEPAKPEEPATTE
jgi:chromosome segregation ATPase